MRRLVIAILFLTGLTATAFAATAIATKAVNVRSGPGTNFAIVDTLSAGEAVKVNECDGNWCHIIQYNDIGPDGWVYGSYLSLVPTSYRRTHRDPCDVDASTEFHMRFGLYFTPLAEYCRERDAD